MIAGQPTIRYAAVVLAHPPSVAATKTHLLLRLRHSIGMLMESRASLTLTSHLL